MRKNFVLTALILALLLNGWLVAYFAVPNYLELIAVGLLSLVFMSILSERYIFLYAITMVLLYGAYLTVTSFGQSLPEGMQIQYMYSHLLFTSFHLIFWMLMNAVKKIGYQNADLQHQVQLLQKYRQGSQILTLTEFKDQAEWVLKSTARNGKESYFLKVELESAKKRTKQNVQEMLEKAALQSIRQKYDLVSSEFGIIYFLLKDTHQEGADIVMERFREKSQAELNFIMPPYRFEQVHIKDAQQLNELLGARS